MVQTAEIMSLAVKPVYSGRAFCTAPYHADSNGRLRPPKPQCCPDHNDGSCRIWVCKYRQRKCGPGYNLVVCRCVVHQIVFTVYPPDWTPYARRSFVALSHDGADTVDDNGVRFVWASTVFQAVIDAAEGRRWSVEAKCVPDDRGLVAPGVFRTQCRHIQGALSLFAIESNASRANQEKVASYFGIGLPVLFQLSNIRDGPWWKKAGQAGATILDTLGAPGKRHLPKLVELGVDRKYWGLMTPPNLSRAL